MAKTKLTWEDIIQYEEIKGYGQAVWRHQGQYYFVTEEGGVAAKRVVYELPNELFQLLENGDRTLLEISFKLRYDCWPPNVTQLEADRIFLKDNPELLRNDADNQALFTRKELEEILPEGTNILASSDG